MQRAETKLQEAFNLLPNQASVLGNGKSHRIKRGCTADEAKKLAAQCASWGADVRIETVSSQAEADPKDDTPSYPSNPVSSLTLAAAGETIPTKPRDMTPPTVSIDHLQLEEH